MINLYSQRLILRAVSLHDLEDLYQLHSFREVAKHNAIGLPESKEVTENIIRYVVEDENTFFKTNFWWTIYSKDSQQFLGEVGMNLSLSEYKSADVYYGLLPRFWGNGYATEAVNIVMNFGFVDLNLQRITAGVATENQPSINLLERIGMMREGKFRKILPIRGECWDNYYYSIIEDDFFKNSF
jgi:RimJ/RimL family protein N-acetyltransferase